MQSISSIQLRSRLVALMMIIGYRVPHGAFYKQNTLIKERFLLPAMSWEIIPDCSSIIEQIIAQHKADGEHSVGLRKIPLVLGLVCFVTSSWSLGFAWNLDPRALRIDKKFS